MTGYIFMIIAILSEIVSTSMLKASAGFTKVIPSIIFVIGMGSAFFFLSKALFTIPLSVAYAIWSGVGTALTAVIAVVIWKEELTMYSILGIAFIIAGVALLNLKGSVH